MWNLIPTVEDVGIAGQAYQNRMMCLQMADGDARTCHWLYEELPLHKTMEMYAMRRAYDWNT